jgi:hypothetical protein
LYAPCDAQLPPLGIKIAGKTFYMDERDLLSAFGEGGYANATDGRDYCLLAVLGGQAPFPFVLGDVFQQSVVSVFDWGRKTLSFAEHIY